MTPHPRQRGTPRVLAVAALLAGLLVVSSTDAQNRNPSGLPAPRLYQVFPAGAKVASTLEIVVAGRNLDEPQKLVFSNPAVKAERVPPPVPEIDPKTKKAKPVVGALPADHYKFKVTVPPNTPLGHLDVRVVGKWGVSNPRTFVVGDLNEVNEKEPNSDVAQAQRLELNTTVNGTIAVPTDVDYYVVKATRGQRVVVACLASSIDSRLQAAVEIYDARDRQLTANRNYLGDDAVTDFTAPADGDYYVRVFQFTHTPRTPFAGGMPPGSSDGFYRLSVTTGPWIDAVVPPCVEPGKSAVVTVYGRNLPGGKLDPTAVVEDSTLEKVTVTVTAPADGKGKLAFSGFVPPSVAMRDGFELRLKNGAYTSNAYRLQLARAPVVLEGPDNDSRDRPQVVTPPCEIAGRVEKRNDLDWYAFTAKRGEAWNIEVFSHRLGAPAYMMILMHNPAAKNDFYESPSVENMQVYSRRFSTRSEDPPAYRFVAPADGQYLLLVRSRAGGTLFGARHTYQARISRDEPSFRLTALSAEVSVPDAATLTAGGQQALSVLVERRDGFSGEVELTVEGLPPGVTCPPQMLAASVRMATVVLSAAADAAEWAGEIKVKGAATVNGVRMVEEARPGGITWPVQPNANITTISRQERSLWLSIRGKAPFTLAPTIDKPILSPGDRATVKVKLHRLLPEMKAPLQLTLMQGQQRQGSQLPINLRFNNNQPINVAPGQAEATLNVTIGNDVPPGVYNVVFRGQTQIPYNKDPKAKQRPNTFIVQPSAPLRVEVLPKAVATVTLSTANVAVKLGGQAEVTVRVQRRFYDGEFKVQLVLPPNVQGVEAAEVTIPAGKDEAKLTLRPAGAANPGNRPNLIVRVTALYNGKVPIVHEARLNVNVTK